MQNRVIIGVAAFAALVRAMLLSTAAADPDAPFVADRRVTLRTGTAPAAVIVADIDGDRDGDIVVANGGAGTVNVFLGNGHGQFTDAPGSPAAAGRNPNDLAAADFNGDSRIDLAIANHDTDYITVLHGSGGGRMTPAPGSPLRVPSRPHPHGIAAGDFDGDRHPDLAVESWEEDLILPLWNDGRGRFSIGAGVPTGDHPYHKLRAADVNADGRSDIVTANLGSGDVTVLLGAPGRRFRQAGGSPFRAGASPFGVAIGDVNRDRRPDIVVIHYSGSLRDRSRDAVRALLGDGAGSFRPADGPSLLPGHAPTSVATGDVDGDGAADVAVGNLGSDDVTVLLGGGTLRPSAVSPLRVGRTPSAVALGDLDGDARADLVVACGDNTVTVLLTRAQQ